MPKSALTPTVLSLLVLLAPAAVTGCSNYGADDDAAGGANGAPGGGNGNGANGNGPGGGADGGGPKAPPVQGPTAPDELVESLGVFVAPSGNDTGDGTRKQPLAHIQAGIDLGKKLGKRVYVCTGTYSEALVLADSISVIGGLGCANPAAWTTGQPKSRLEAPASPAIVAKGMTTDTRLEGFDVVAPDATEPSASSIGLLAVNSPKLVIAATKIAAGNAANGADGADGVQLVQAGAPAGAATGWEDCSSGPETCKSALTGAWIRPSGGAGGTSVCSGAPGHDGERGGQGGSGGLQEVVLIGGGPLGGPSRNGLQTLFANDAAYGHTAGEARTGAPGADGTDGANGAAVGTLTESGYAPADGIPGGHGLAGKGGAGGAGLRAGVNAPDEALGTRFRGDSGAGGGAGGCPGLAGTAGTGGGASLAAVLLESPVVLDGVELTAKHGGDAGRGTFGSDPTQGGAAGYKAVEISRPSLSGRPGGNGGAAGVSGNGSAGPSIALVTKGAAPTIKGATTTTAGEPGAGVEARSRTGALGHVKTIPATPAGIAKATHAL